MLPQRTGTRCSDSLEQQLVGIAAIRDAAAAAEYWNVDLDSLVWADC